MGLKIDSGFRTFATGSVSEFARAYLRRLESYGAAEGFQSILWRLSQEALQNPHAGRLSAARYLDLCDQHILKVSDSQKNYISVQWILRKGDQQQNWKLKLYLSQVPHFQGDFFDSNCDPIDDWPGSIEAERQKLIDSGVTHIVFTRKETYGMANWLYIDAKFARSRYLQKLRRDSAWNGASLVDKLAEIAGRQLLIQNPVPITLSRLAMHSFIKTADQAMLVGIGADRFAELISCMGLSLKDWLAIS